MTQPGRSRFDVQVALATASARLAVPPAPVQPLVPHWRRAASKAVRLARRVLRAQLRGGAGEQPRQDIPAPDDGTRQQAQLLRQEVDAARDELRLVYTGLVDEAWAARCTAERELAALRERLGEQQQSLQLALAQLARVENYAGASARRVALPCAGGEVLVKTEAGYVLCADTDLALLSTLVDSGDIERGTRLLIESLLRPGDCFVDIGANIGMHTVAAGRAMGAQGTLIAFEPFEPTRRLLEKTLWINGLAPVTLVHGCALSDQAGTQPLFLGASSGHHSLFALTGAEAPSPPRAQVQVQVPTMRLDDVLGPGRRVTLLKIDAEGAELAVLAGAAATLRNNPDIALIAEFGPAHLHRAGHDTAHWLAAFEAHGFAYRAIDPASGVLARRTAAELAAEESVNLFFARPGTAAWAHVKETT